MRRILSLLVIHVLITGCDTSNSSEIINPDGMWSTICDSTSPVNFIIGSTSNKRVMSFSNGTISNQIYLYSDIACSDLVSIENNGLFAGLLVSYVIGSGTTTIDGNRAKEIDFTDSNGNLLPDIYILLDTNSTLHLGIKEPALMVQCPSSGQFDPPLCWSVRPNEINYDELFTKVVQ